MPFEEVPGTDVRYHLIAYDAAGIERPETEGLRSHAVVQGLTKNPATDVFLFSHGWQGDVPAAGDQYNRWIGTMAACSSDLEKVAAARDGSFRPLLIGLHWPSLPFGDETMGAGNGSFGLDPTAEPSGSSMSADAQVESMVEAYASRIADTPTARAALRVIFSRAIEDVAPDRLPPEVADACTVLDRESGLGAGGEGAEPGSDRESFDPEAVYAAVQEEEAVNFGDSGLGGLLALPRTLSFWRMKARARTFGEGGAHDLLHALMQAGGPDVRFHLMGHSFGCIVASSILSGQSPLLRPVDTLVLLQGALSLWSFCPEIPSAPGRPGYFHPIIRDGRVRGPIVTTQSEYDTAVGRWYPLAAGVKRQVDYDDRLPKYGAVGTFGLCGLDALAQFMPMLSASETYDFLSGRIYNLESSAVIRETLSTFSGAHSDLAHPEVGHAVWSAVLGETAAR